MVWAAADLNLEDCGGPVFYDVSQDRADATTTVDGTDGSQPGHLIVDTTWRTAPGDKTAVAFCLDVTLEGDNMIGKLSLGGGRVQGHELRQHVPRRPVYLDLRCWDTSAATTTTFFSAGNTGGLKEPIWGGPPVCP